VLALPRIGPYNVHASLLPRHRGAAPIQWAVIRGDARTGVAIMRMEAGLDTGPVVSTRELPISDDDTAGSLFARLATIGAELLVDTIPSLAAGTAVERTQDHGAATLAPMLKKEDGWLDFAQPARLVSARARGVDPWPGAYALLDAEPIKLFRPRLVAGAGAPGEVLGSTADGLAIACGDGAIAFAELQLPGRKRLPAAAVLAGRPIPVGTRLVGGQHEG
jgi:methionyl-tRNA formyltransferase